MKPLSKPLAKGLAATALYFFPPIIVTSGLAYTTNNEISLAQNLLALTLLFAPWVDYRRWKRNREQGLPLFGMLAFMYWLYFVGPLYGGNIREAEQFFYLRTLSEEAITKSLLLAAIGVLALHLGMISRLGRRLVPARIPDVQPLASKLNYIRFVLLAGTLFSFYESAPYILGEGSRQIVLILQTTLPTVAFALLFRHYLQGKAANFDKLLIGFFLLARLLVGMSSGWLGNVTFLIITCAVIYIGERRKIPRLAVVMIAITILFFQAGKKDFRNNFWYGNDQTGKVGRMQYWFGESVGKWEGAITGKGQESIQDLTYLSVSRISLLTETANVIDLTPSVVPYQYWRLYSYVFVTLIPRFVWPDKPTFNEANQFYQVAYNMAPESSLSTVSMSVGFLTEGYISFGWTGALLVMYFLGLVLDFYKHAFLHERSGLLLRAIGVALLPQLLTIESQFAVYLSGLVQQVLVVGLVMLPIIYYRNMNAPARTKTLTRRSSAKPTSELLSRLPKELP